MAYSTRIMSFLVIYLFIISNFNVCSNSGADTPPSRSLKEPSVTIAFIARNTASNLPWFLGCIEALDYPKDRISIWVRTDHNEDDTAALLQDWVKSVSQFYHQVNLTIDVDGRYEDEISDLSEWTNDRYSNVIRLRQEALDAARHSWSDYLLMIDTDQFISDKNLLQHLMDEEKPIVAPMMNSTTLYTNFWGAVNEKGFYVRSDDYLDIYDRFKVGTFDVPMVHSVFLMELRDRLTDYMQYNPPLDSYTGPIDDILHFAHCARSNNVPMYITNKHYFGYLIPPVSKTNNVLDTIRDYGLYVRLTQIHDGKKLNPSPYVPVPPPKFSKKLGFDEVYMINLARRPDRKKLMEEACAELGIEYKYFEAVDGKQLNTSYLEKIGVKQLDGYLDPYHKRPMKFGEIGCFLSHYFIWKEMEEKGYERILIFEDDVRFRLNFVKSFYDMMDEADRHINGWDLLYIGRKIMTEDEVFVPNANHLVYPSYTYWTLSYALTRSGLKKLLSQDPISNMLPIDEFLPIMFDAHTNKKWKSHFSPRDVIALSANPLFVEPLKYIGEVGYVSDTEDSSVITQSKQDASLIEPTHDVNYNTSDSVNRNEEKRPKGPHEEL